MGWPGIPVNDAICSVSHLVSVLPEFALACLVLAFLPGPGMTLFLHRTIRDGRRCGLYAVAGNELGLFGWTLAAGGGLTALLRANRLLFDGLHIAGGLVLVYLGVSAWRSSRRDPRPTPEPTPEPTSEPTSEPPPDSPGSGSPRLAGGRTPLGSFRASLVSIAANPKAAVFTFTFYPEFLPRHGPVFAGSLALGLFQVLVIDAPACVLIVLVATRIRPWLSRAVIRRRMERLLGAILVALGVELAASTR
jgi:threonine/homoserine/homoserine lactone efflux protein